MARKKTKEEHLLKFIKKHGDKYNYSKFLDDSFILEGANQKIPIICTIHGEWNTTSIAKHYSGRGCPECGKIKVGDTKRKTKEQYLSKFIKEHDGFYNYSLFESDDFILKGNHQKIPIICPIHGMWKTTTIAHHYGGNGCPECAKIKISDTKRKSKDYFILKAKKEHDDFYDYSKFLDDSFILEGNGQKIPIICPIHGEWDTTTIANHINGNGCTKCSNIKTANRIKKTKEERLKIFGEAHNNFYDYSLIEVDDFTLTGAFQKIPIICPIHGMWDTTTVDSHGRGAGCPKCSIIENTKKQRNTTSEWRNKFKLKHKYKYKYPYLSDDDTIIENNTQKLIIECSIHGEWNTTTFTGHAGGTGCPKCKSSKGELKVEELLKENNIKFTNQKRFKECKFKRPLPFDFYLPDQNICIEYDGRQHFIANHAWDGEEGLKLTKKKDRIKNKFCKDNGIKLLRIRYDEDIEEKMKELIK